MASRYSLSLDKQSVGKRFQIDAGDLYRPRYNAAPAQLLPVLTPEEPSTLSYFYWGQTPEWSKNKTLSLKLIHADLEIMREKSTFHRALQKRRCLIPADGFYVWKRLGKKSQVPYRVILTSGDAFAIPGIWEDFENENDEKITTFKMITVPANPVVGDIEPIMPAILPPKQEKQWLDDSITLEDAMEILKGSHTGEMTKYTVSPKINQSENDDPSVMQAAPAADQFGNYSLFD